MDLSILFLMVAGLILVIGSAVGMTTYGKTRPMAVLTCILAATIAYMSIILVRIGMIDLSWLIPGA